jgi:hypothetical protein
MDDLIEALTIFRKYANERWPQSAAQSNGSDSE